MSYYTHPALRLKSLVPSSHLAEASPIYFEGGDFLIISENILLIGIGARTTSQGVDFVIDHLRKNKSRKHIIVQQLPLKPESFIHLDMVFTVIDLDLYMIYEPIILNQYDYQAVHIILDNGQVESIREEKNIPAVLQKLGFEGQLALCGGKTDDWIQEREQWHNGTDAPVEDINPFANFYAAVTRNLTHGGSFYPEQCMTREEALQSYTFDAAYAAFEEDIKGSITAGKLADIVVLSQDILTIPVEKIPQTEILYTIVGGKILYTQSMP